MKKLLSSIFAWLCIAALMLSAKANDPATGPGQSCRSPEECPGHRCLAPGEAVGCGTCYPGDDCSSDASCQSLGEEYICAPAECSCGPVCTRGCVSDSACPAGAFCAPNHRCVARPCTAAEDCPANFDCSGPGELHCVRRPCASDRQCEDFCVDGQCYEALGTCSYWPI